jgi:hypothetical protein
MCDRGTETSDQWIMSFRPTVSFCIDLRQLGTTRSPDSPVRDVLFASLLTRS